MMRLLVLLFGIMVSFSLQAKPRGIPPALLFHNNPIDPLCFSHQEKRATFLIQLRNCGLSYNQWIKKTPNDYLIKNGFIGFDWQDPKLTNPIQGFSYYKFFDAGNRQYWVYSVNGSGGTGEFTEVSLVSRKSFDTLEMTSVMAGDRCNGGIQEVKEKNHVLWVSTNITAFDLLTIASDNLYHLKAYEDLSACAACCLGKAVYTISTDLKPQFNYVILPRRLPLNTALLQQGKYQACFNKILSSYTTKGKTKLDQATLNNLGNEFNTTCIETSAS